MPLGSKKEAQGTGFQTQILQLVGTLTEGLKPDSFWGEVENQFLCLRLGKIIFSLFCATRADTGKAASKAARFSILDSVVFLILYMLG